MCALLVGMLPIADCRVRPRRRSVAGCAYLVADSNELVLMSTGT
jgi:hypothetical protein